MREKKARSKEIMDLTVISGIYYMANGVINIFSSRANNENIE